LLSTALPIAIFGGYRRASASASQPNSLTRWKWCQAAWKSRFF